VSTKLQPYDYGQNTAGMEEGRHKVIKKDTKRRMGKGRDQVYLGFGEVRVTPGVGPEGGKRYFWRTPRGDEKENKGRSSQNFTGGGASLKSRIVRTRSETESEVMCTGSKNQTLTKGRSRDLLGDQRCSQVKMEVQRKMGRQNEPNKLVNGQWYWGESH